MKPERRGVLGLALIFGAVFLYFAFPLFVEGVRSVRILVTLAGTVLWALPQIVWWFAAAALLVLWGLAGIVSLAAAPGGARKKEAGGRSSFSGRLRAIHRILSRGGSGGYFQEEVRRLLRSRAVDFIALKLDLSEEEALQRFQGENWTEDALVKEYFFAAAPGEDRRPARWPWSGKSKNPDFVDKTRVVLGRLEAYGDFNGGKGKHEPIDLTP